MSRPAHSGFTLLEMLVALAIAAIVITSISAVVLALTRHNTTVIEHGRNQQALREAISILQQELSSVVIDKPGGTARFNLENRDLYGKPASTLQFYTLNTAVAGKTSDQLRVRYSPTESPSGLVLRRSCADAFSVNQPDFQKDYPILGQLDGFLVECFNGSSWVSIWDSNMQTNLPQKIRITITIKRQGQTEPFHFIIIPRISSNA